MQSIYSLIWWLGLPVVLVRLWLRGKKEPGYRAHIGERLGFYRQLSAMTTRPRIIWVHAVSVGETRAAQPLIDALLAAYPVHTILLTHMTATGRQTGHDVFISQGRRVIQSFLPYDTQWMTGRFLRYFKPELCILMETEVWPNMMAQCARQGVPVMLANARLSERSLQRGLRLGTIMQQAAQRLQCVAAQTEADAGRLKQFGAKNIHVTGSLKFDVRPAQSLMGVGIGWRRQIGERPILLCASTREGEEKLILDALAKHTPDWLTIIVPRHPQRFDEVEQLVKDAGFNVIRRSQMGDAPIGKEVDVLLGDSMGEMVAYYAAGDVAFIGGSLLPLGGQNMIEACMLGRPVLLGEHTFNFLTISNDAVKAGAALRVANADDLIAHAGRLLQDETERNTMAGQARAFAKQHQGATQRTMALVETMIQG
jgi:3-deoxy-D-manno-octulosonic-acid transferase